MAEAGWTLHPQLEHDAALLGDLALCRVLAMDDADTPWLILVPRRPGVTELFDLGDEAGALMGEIAQIARVLKDVTRCDKINVAAIGNVVSQLHVHVVARRKDDALWPKPVWGAGSRRAGDAARFATFIATMRSRLALNAAC